MKKFLLKLIDLAEWPFYAPHDWWIVEWMLKKITPKKVWEYYGNPLCYAYCFSVAHWYYRVYKRVSEYGELQEEAT